MVKVMSDEMQSFLETTSAHGFPHIARTSKAQIKVRICKSI